MRVHPTQRSLEAQTAIDEKLNEKYERLKKQRMMQLALGKLTRYMAVTWNIQSMWNCRACGCLVTDRVLHDQFHNKYQTKVVVVSEDYDLEGEYGRI